PFVGKPGFEHRIGSALDAPLVGECLDRCDVTVHLAAAVGVRLIVEKPVHTIETNVKATEVVLAAAAKKQRPVLLASTSEVYGSGEQTRCVGHVKDAVEALVRLLETPGAVGQVFNVGNDEEVSILGLAEKVRAAAKSSSAIVKIPYSEAYAAGFEDMARRVP